MQTTKQTVAQAVSNQVSHSKVKAVGTSVFVSFTNPDPVMNETRWAQYQELINRTVDSLQAHRATFSETHGACETRVRGIGTVELYTAHFEVTGLV